MEPPPDHETASDNTILYNTFLGPKVTSGRVLAGYLLLPLMFGLSLLFAFSVLALIQGTPPSTDSVYQTTPLDWQLRAIAAAIGLGVSGWLVHRPWRPYV